MTPGISAKSVVLLLAERNYRNGLPTGEMMNTSTSGEEPRVHALESMSVSTLTKKLQPKARVSRDLCDSRKRKRAVDMAHRVCAPVLAGAVREPRATSRQRGQARAGGGRAHGQASGASSVALAHHTLRDER